MRSGCRKQSRNQRVTGLEPALHSSAHQPIFLTWTTKPHSSLSMLNGYEPSVKQRMPSQRVMLAPLSFHLSLFAGRGRSNRAKSMLSWFYSPNMSGWIVLLHKVYRYFAKCQLRFLKIVCVQKFTHTEKNHFPTGMLLFLDGKVWQLFCVSDEHR